MTEPLISDVFNTTDTLNPATVETNGLLIPWEVFDELGVSLENRDQADAIFSALLKLGATKYPVSARDTDFNISITGLIERGTTDVQFDAGNNTLNFDNFTATFNLYRPASEVDLDPDTFIAA